MARKTPLRVGWVIPTIGAFGAVREMVEVSNALVRRGHEVTIFHPEGGPCMWLPCLARTGTLTDLAAASLDILIGIIDWKPQLYAALVESQAKVKAIRLMGFEPSEEMAAALRGEGQCRDRAWQMIRDAIVAEMMILADSNWQVDWVRQNVGIEAGPAFGGVNLRQFHPPYRKPQRTTRRLIASGDPRTRKGSDVVMEAFALVARVLDGVEMETYWGRRFTQAKLVEFLQSGDLFLDGHRRAGWCNPVAEAMACGTGVVCTDIGAVRDFAIDEETALVSPVNDAEAMAAAAVRLLADDELRRRLVANGLERIQYFAYERVAPRLEQALLERLA